MAKGADERQCIVAALQKTNWMVSGDRGGGSFVGYECADIAVSDA